jgi:hypothetical protein
LQLSLLAIIIKSVEKFKAESPQNNHDYAISNNGWYKLVDKSSNGGPIEYRRYNNDNNVIVD